MEFLHITVYQHINKEIDKLMCFVEQKIINYVDFRRRAES